MRRNISFVETSTAQTMRAALDMATMLRFPVLAFGDVGLGKSAALEQLRTEGKAAYWEVPTSIKGHKTMFLMLMEAYCIMPSKKNTYDLDQQLMRALGGRYVSGEKVGDHPLIVDEYQNLAPTLLRELFRLQERCEFPLLLSGNRERLASTKRDASAMEQIESRIGQRFQIGKPTRLDCINIGAEYNVEGRDAYDAIANYGQNTSLRALCHLLDKCVAATGGVGSIGLRHIEMVLRGTPAGRDALKLLQSEQAA